MLAYFDNCTLQRPLDDQTQLRIFIETQAVLGLLTLVQAGKIQLIHSEVLAFEIDLIPNLQRKSEVLHMLANAHVYLSLTDAVENTARQYELLGIRAMDALHLALAHEYQARYFVTTDDKLLSKAKGVKPLSCRPVSPTELILELAL